MVNRHVAANKLGGVDWTQKSKLNSNQHEDSVDILTISDKGWRASGRDRHQWDWYLSFTVVTQPLSSIEWNMIQLSEAYSNANYIYTGIK